MLCLILAAAACAQDLPRGKIIDDVKCAADASQSYTLYLPFNYSADRTWAVIFAFDAGGRGRRGVERLQAAAEKYGYIVAGSNNSRNGPWQVSMTAAQTMTRDVVKRFSIDPHRMYTAGQSGGARVAMKVAIDTGQISGVIASSAVYPDDETRQYYPFVVFGTAGTEDFNYLELRKFNRETGSPHRVRIFEGGHQWMSSDLAMEAVEWMEIQAMKSGLRVTDEAMVQKIFAKRVAQAAALKNDFETYLALNSIAGDFDGGVDISKIYAHAAALGRQAGVQEAIKKDKADDLREEKLANDLYELEGEVLSDDPNTRPASFAELKERLLKLSAQARVEKDSADRRRARRLLAGILQGSRRIEDPEYRKLLDQVQLPAQP